MAHIGRSLLLVVRSESINDFREIARRVRKIDPAIDVLIFGDTVDPTKIPSHFLKQPLLSIYLVNPPPEDFVPQSGQLAVKGLNKLQEYEHFKKHNIPCLPIEEFKWGMTLDESIYGDWVVLKPQHIQSTGRDINMIPTKLIPTLKLEDFPEKHLIREDSYYVQKFVKTGENATHYRAYIFLNEILLTTQSISKITIPSIGLNIKEVLEISVASNNQEYRNVILFEDEKIMSFALKVAATFKDIPLLGIDILVDALTKEMYVLEVNAGGNTWAFSSEIASHFRESAGGKKKLILQYNAWDKASEALVRKNHEIAK